MRAREPDRCGYAVRSGVRLYYEVAGSGPTTILLPAWATEVFAGGGHCVQARHPVRFNLALPTVVSAVRGR